MYEPLSITVNLDKATTRVVYCKTCRRSIAEYNMGIENKEIVRWMVDIHTNHASAGKTRIINHELVTMIVRTKEVVPGVDLGPPNLQ